MLPVLQLGPLALQMPGLMYLLGLWLGLDAAEKMATRRRESSETLYNLVITALIAGVLGARLGYAAQYPNAFLQSPASLLSLNPGLLDPFFGFAAALLAALVYGNRKRLSFWKTADALTPFFAVFMVGAALSHAASGQAFGAETDLPWGILLWGAKRHPSQFYELAAALLTLWGVTHLANRQNLRPGSLFLAFSSASASAALFLQAFRGDSALLPGGIRTEQLIAWLLLAAALFFLNRLYRPQNG